MFISLTILGIIGKEISSVIYYDKKSQKAIYGNTTPEEREELAEEGIDLISIPCVNKENYHFKLQLI